jgi:hypothetical protein
VETVVTTFFVEVIVGAALVLLLERIVSKAWSAYLDDVFHLALLLLSGWAVGRLLLNLGARIAERL